MLVTHSQARPTLFCMGSEFQLAFIHVNYKHNIGIFVSHAPRTQGQGTGSKGVSLAVTWMPSLNLWCMKSQKSKQVFHIVSPSVECIFTNAPL